MQRKPHFLRFPRSISQRAVEHGLGLPQRVHTQWFNRFVLAGCGGFFLFVGLGNLVFLIFGLYSPQDASQVGLGFWLGLALAFLFAIPFLIGAFSFKDVVYECSSGFLVVRGRRQQVILELRWNEIERAWHSLGHKDRRYFIEYRKGNHDPERFVLFSKRLWERCDFEVRHRHIKRQRRLRSQ
ncbi:MAG TPA: hypothetical protein VFN35_21335 [Ktedonobacteraceae bacterium]|nr:hypothetical protein [Ktedonobacteraceae bacterium]